jgi:hypothetical protein
VKFCWRARDVNRIAQALLIAIALLSFSEAGAQSQGMPLLERSVTISFENETLEAALKKVSQQAGFTFSYNPSVIKAGRIISGNYVNKTVREILDELFKTTIDYKQRGNYIILTRSERTSTPKEQKVGGYVIDEATGERLKNVSIYDPNSLASTVTDDYGYFSIDIPESAKDSIKLAVRKQNYTDTLVAVPSNDGLMKIRIRTDKIEAFADSLGHKMKRFWLSTKELTQRAINFENIDDTLYRNFQFSVVPFVGTNHKMSGHVINDFSLNLLGGHSLGTTTFEMGGLFNTVRGDVSGFQAAGLFNLVGGKLNSGIQLGGLVNVDWGPVRGIQMAGLANFTADTSDVVALAGLMNFNLKDARGVSLAGIGNLTIGKQQGPRIAGLFNFADGNAEPLQLAGIFNFALDSMKGAQVAGIFNFTEDLRGVQAGLINYATHVHGTQIGFLNISNSVKGIPIGFLSIVGKGQHQIEIFADEIFYTNLAFRTGIRQFYNILTAGIKPETKEGEENIWTFGYGIGTAPKINPWFWLNFDLTANEIVYGGSVEGLHLLNKLYFGAELKPSKNLGLTLGATLNGYLTKTTEEQQPSIFSHYRPHIFEDRTFSNDVNLKMWWGFKVGLRFL